ncbi:hypothetical protein M378DRAFT_378038 [Amanita muscaria Koide BX008]|uniref:Uncharacterized protein n=1 Tax=Amanita muscaria (strain Koide BX008) TaxID=946122 RepID=A0A0C2S4K0_AMAMK|nr:hypothetical protein M378DRAFT_378038 [Amanita muscaria Koide BX008]
MASSEWTPRTFLCNDYLSFLLNIRAVSFFRKWATILTSEPVSSVVKYCGQSISYRHES